MDANGVSRLSCTSAPDGLQGTDLMSDGLTAIGLQSNAELTALGSLDSNVRDWIQYPIEKSPL